jgi:hypothetical protein
MRSYFLILFAAVCFCLGEPDRSVAQTVHAVLVADTLDRKLGAGVAENRANIKSFLKNVQTLTGLNVASTEVAGADFNCKSIVSAIDNLNVSADDVVFFYYAGHGFRRDSSQTKFPEFYCRRTADPDEPDETLSQAVESISAKRPRLIIAIADACNKETQPPPTVAAELPDLNVDRKGALLRLFKDYRGTLVMTGAIPGEYSWYMTAGASLGGFFTNQLLGAINQNINSSGAGVRWEAIATDATQPIYVPAIPPTTQNPQYSTLNLSVGPTSAGPDDVSSGARIRSIPQSFGTSGSGISCLKPQRPIF